MLKIIKSAPVVIKGVFKFGLKEVSKGLIRNGLLKSKDYEEFDNGLDAMIKAYEAYE
jgi:hypothetical protein